MKHCLFWIASAMTALLTGSAVGDQPQSLGTGAHTLALFTFNDMAVRGDGTTLADDSDAAERPTAVMHGGSFRDGDGQKGTGFVDARGQSHSPGQAAAWGSGVNDSPDNALTVRFASHGYRRLALRADCRVSDTGPSTLNVEYRVGQGEYQLIATVPVVRDKDFHPLGWDLSSWRKINDQSEVEIRMSWSADGRGVGTARLDNVQITGEPRGDTTIGG